MKKMRVLFKILIIALITGCSLQTEKTTVQNSESQIDSVSSYVDLSVEHVGFWVYGSYFETLQKTKSTKKAGEMEVDDFYRISKDNSIMRMNIHEGGADNIILMTSKNIGQIFSSDTTEAYYKVEFRDKLMIVDGKKFIKAPNNENGFNELVNSAFVSGKYKIDDIEVEFKTSGTILGMDSLLSYELNLDYNDAGMQLDKIYLMFKNNPDAVPYTYQMNMDTLLISEIECKTFEDDFCVEIEKGKTVYKLIKE
jgi:hypothetical protein